MAGARSSTGPDERYFDDSLRGGDGIRSRFILFVGEDVEASTREGAQRLAGSHPDVVDLRRSSAPGLTLVRPDGYVASAPHSGGAEAVASLASVLQAQIAPVSAEAV